MDQSRSMADHELLDPEEWVDQYGDYLYRYALSRVRDPANAEDLVQETFVAALHTRQTFQGRSSEKTWLTAILKHKIMDHFRKQSREQPSDDIETLAESVDEVFDEKGNWKIKPTEWAADPVKLYEQKEFWGVFYRCLSELSRRLATAFTLREMDGLSTEEICKTLNVSATNVWVMLYRARMYIRRCLEINWFDTSTTKDS
jgi:RNA polymerase sigma-70 factor (ECF subfamily)